MNCEKLKAFLLRSGIRQSFPLLPFFFNNILEILANVIKEDMGIKGILTRKEKTLFTDDIIVYAKTRKE
jgi:hypothetical protein